MNFYLAAGAVLTGYLIGSVNIAILITSLFLKNDVREMGSKNAGATNVARVFGMKMGLITLGGDFLKTFCAMMIGFFLGGKNGAMLSALACQIGHCWPVYYRFRGGKGVAVGAAIALFLDWRFFLVLAVIFFAVFFFTRRVSACSLASALFYPFGLWIFGHVGVMPVVLGLGVFAIVWFMHRGNIARLLNGTEPTFRPGNGK